MEYLSQIILQIQQEHTQAVDELAKMLKEQFDLFVDIALLRVLFREDHHLSIVELEMQMFELEMLYENVKAFDLDILAEQNKIESLVFTLNNI